jgi:hypothetical protein
MPLSPPKKKWWEIESMPWRAALRTPEDTLGQHLLEAAFFDEVQPCIEDGTLWWSIEDSIVLIDLAGTKEEEEGSIIKEEPKDPPEDNIDWSDHDGGSDDGASTDYSVFYRYY